ncbi:DUF3185 family protein [Paraferrimonas haliotis]|uniref:DUF3185 family protein n=1 Tax=Paraferrimonas haliotis TaxID=2013866 RepID=A0AA37TLA4_9GAMM|nr:DUF3185 family protein [Paraferrimonas haliotis]GLS83617.1 hypothetical protein GCM10007894_15940 [Paraferrimonas haliotis]
MAASSGSALKLVGIVLLIAGCGLGYWGYEMSQGAGAQLGEMVSGSKSDGVMYRYIGGAICAAVGLFLLKK